MKILLAIDSSPHSEAVVLEVERRPWPADTTVCVLTVVDLLALTSAMGYLEPFLKGEDQAAHILVDAVAKRLAQHQLRTTTTVIEGYPGTSIVDAAAEWNADLILVGSHGHSGFVSFLLGSIAKAVVQNAPCSVGIVRHPRHEKRSTDQKTEVAARGFKILLGIDGSAHSLVAAASIASRKWPQDSVVRIVSVPEQPVPPADPSNVDRAVAARAREVIKKNCESAVGEARDIVGAAGIGTETCVLEGSPKKRILEESKAWGADLIVVGSHGRRGVTRYLLGSVAEAVAMHAQCSVEVIRDKNLLIATETSAQ
jgi:nucleotide-binding universal stress UspA family protein